MAAIGAAANDNLRMPGRGTLPLGRGGGDLNLDFETDDLWVWKAEGSGGVLPSVLGDGATATLTSEPLRVAVPGEGVLVAAGAFQATRVELIDAAGGEVLLGLSGIDGHRRRPDNKSPFPECGRNMLPAPGNRRGAD